MSDTELQFRTAAFGGFQKQDVLNYIETSNQAHREKVEELTRELEEVRKAQAELEAEGTQAREQAQAGDETVRKLEGELEEARNEAKELKDRLESTEAELERLRAALAEAEGKLAQAEPAAQAYEQVKDRTAGIELEAHCRAQAVQAEAEERVEKARQDLEQWLNKVRKSYADLRADMTTTITHAGSELERAHAALAELTNRFCAQDERLEKMVQSFIGEHKAPDPLPLEDQKKA